MSDQERPKFNAWAGDPTLCVNHKLLAVKASYAEGGVPRCHICFKNESYKAVKKEFKQREKGGKVGGARGVHMPESLVKMYEESQLDENLIALREDIATTEARLRQLLRQIKENPKNGLPYWTQISGVIETQKKLIRSKAMTVEQAYLQLAEEIESGPIKENVLWGEFYKATEMKRKLVATESKRLNDLGWSPDVVMGMIAEIADILKPMLTELNMRSFMEALASSPLFNNDQFRVLGQMNLTARTIEEHLMLQEVNKIQEGSVIDAEFEDLKETTNGNDTGDQPHTELDDRVHAEDAGAVPAGLEPGAGRDEGSGEPDPGL